MSSWEKVRREFQNFPDQELDKFFPHCNKAGKNSDKPQFSIFFVMLRRKYWFYMIGKLMRSQSCKPKVWHEIRLQIFHESVSPWPLEMAPMVQYTQGPSGNWFMKKNLKSKISCQAPFKKKHRPAMFSVYECTIIQGPVSYCICFWIHR